MPAKSDIRHSKSTPPDSKRANVRSSAEVTRAKSLEMDTVRAKLFSAEVTREESMGGAFRAAAEVFLGAKSVKKSLEAVTLVLVWFTEAG